MSTTTTESSRLLLSGNDTAGLERYLAERGWLECGERVNTVARAGEGNMNLTLRVSTSRRSVIVKQGRPWVEKYPSIAAPPDRTLVEADWYTIAGSSESVSARTPQLLAIDPDGKVLMLGDLGDAGDYLHLYNGATLGQTQLESLVDWLLDLHLSFAGDSRAARLTNRPMRELNHEHIFEVPFRPDNGLDLDGITPGLIAVAAELRTDRELMAAIRAVGELYLGTGTTLLHGDYYPGSWLQANEPWIIDPEFGFYGLPEFDLGVMLAHLKLAQQPIELRYRTIMRYRAAAPRTDPTLALAFAGVEILRRLLGVSQLPVNLGLDAKRTLIEQACRFVRASA